MQSDPEVDPESTGSFLREVSRIYIDQDRQIVHKISRWAIVRNPDGTQRERRARKLAPPNVASETPLKWSGILIKKREAYRRFVFVSKQQLVHVNGLTYDFLYGMAKELEEQDSLMLVGGGPKSNQPLILRRGSSPHRGFLEGRTDGDKYCLVLHLSNMELKAPAPIEAKPTVDAEAAAEEKKDEKQEPSAKKKAAKKDAPSKETPKKVAKKKAVKKKAVKKKAVKKKAAKKKAAKKKNG